MPASRTFDLLNILGVSAHTGEYGSNSNTVADAQYLGIRKWRDGINITSAVRTVYQSLYNAGIRFIGLPWPPGDPSVPNNIGYAENIASIGPGAVCSGGAKRAGKLCLFFNGVNTANSWSAVAGFQHDWYAAVKADPNLSGVPVWTPSLVGQELDNWGLQYLTVPAGPPAGENSAAGTVFADAFNMHLYPMYQGQAQTIDPTNGDSFVHVLAGDFVSTYAHGFAGYTLPVAQSFTRAITEFGYPATGGTAGGVTTDVPTQGKNILNGLMNAWGEGLIAFTIYTFYEQGDGFGFAHRPWGPEGFRHLHAQFHDASERHGGKCGHVYAWVAELFSQRITGDGQVSTIPEIERQL
jgi:hypothetical protein